MYCRCFLMLSAIATIGFASRSFSQEADDWRFKNPIQRLREVGILTNKADKEESVISARIGQEEKMIWIANMSEAEAKKADTEKQFEKVTEVTLHGHYAASVLDSVATMVNLEKLEFYECGFGHQDGSLSLIAKRCPKLKELRFHQCRISRYVFRFLATFENVEELELEDTYVGDGIIKYATCFPKLELAELICTGAGDRDAEELAKLKHFRRVGFHESALSAKGLRKLAASPTVDWILGEFVEVTDDEASAIEKEFPKVTIEMMLEPALK